MQRIDGRLVFSPTDLNNFLECEYLTRLDIEVANGRSVTVVRSPEADLLAAKGEAHERRFLEQLEGERGQAVKIDATGRDWMAAASATRDAMVSGAPIIYQVARMNAIGILTATDVAGWAGDVDGIGATAFGRLKHQASLQVDFRTTGRHRYDLLPADDENGFRLLPPPSEGDIYFDMEGFPFFDTDGGLEYLFGAITIEAGQPSYHAFRAADRTSERQAFQRFIDFAWDRLRRWPDLHIYHYAHYEPTTLKRLMTVHATREDELDELLRREAFIDLYQVVRRSLRISHDSYSIKAVRQFFMQDAGKGVVTGGAQSILEFQRWIDTGDQQILDAIERYNEEDCVSTLQLHRCCSTGATTRARHSASTSRSGRYRNIVKSRSRPSPMSTRSSARV